MKRLLIAVLLLLFSCSSEAQFRVATGSLKGTYSTMFRELNQQCADQIPLVEVNTSGSIENVNMLTGNQVNAAFTQTDVLYYRAKTENLDNIKTLLALRPEEVHVVAMRDSGLKEGGTLGFGAKPVVFNNVSDLAGRRVGAAGGSYITAQFIRLQSEISFTVVQYQSNDALLKALAAGEVEAALMVVGAPAQVVNALPQSYKLLAFPEAVVERLKSVYRPARLNYGNLQAQGVPTVATDALFVTREYKTAKITQGLAKLRACALGKLDELKETTGTHPKWQAVTADNKGKWAWYELK